MRSFWGDRETFKRGLYASAATAMALVFTSQALAQSESGGVETITVTAEKRAENIQNVPMSVSALSGETLQQLGITNIQYLAPLIPNFAVVAGTNNVRDTSVIIRNIGSSGTNPGIEPDVGVFIDGVYNPAGGAIMQNLVDIGDVEVLRGPQGTLYGRNTVVGAVNITTRAPTQETEGMVDLTIGNYGYQRVTGFVGGGLADDLAGRLSFYEDSNTGTEFNLASGSNVDGQQEFGGRGRLLWTPTSDLTINVIGGYDSIHSECCVAATLDPFGVGGIATAGFLSTMAAAGTPFKPLNYDNHDVDSTPNPDNDSKIAEASVSADLVLPFDATLTSISGYNLFVNNLYEQPGWSLPINFGASSQFESTASYSEELRLASQTGGFLEYLFGLYGFYQDTSYHTFAQLESGANRVYPGGPAMQTKPGDNSSLFFHQLTDSGAAFGQVKLNFTDDLHLIGGIRYSYSDKEGSVYNVDGAGDSAKYLSLNPASASSLKYGKGKMTWLVTGQYNITKDDMAYATMATGFKDGGFNARTAPSAGFPLTFGPETATTYEVGAKTAWFDNKVIFNADIYRMTVYGYQQSTYDAFLPTPGFIVGNAGDLHTQGYEADLTAKPIDYLTITGSIGLAAEKISDYSQGTCSTYPGHILTPKNPNGTCNYNGLAPAFSPRMRWSIDGEWEAPLTASLNYFFGGDIDWTGSQYLIATLDPPSFQDSVLLLNLRAGVESSSGTWRLMAWARNVTNVTYFNSATTQPQAANISGGGTNPVQGYVGWYSPPRTVGIEGSYHF